VRLCTSLVTWWRLLQKRVVYTCINVFMFLLLFLFYFIFHWCRFEYRAYINASKNGRGNQEWPIQRNLQQLHKTKTKQKEKKRCVLYLSLSCQSTLDNTDGAIKHGQSRVRVHKTKKHNTNTQHNICWTALYTNKHK
jgi:hypothetical protein